MLFLSILNSTCQIIVWVDCWHVLLLDKLQIRHTLCEKEKGRLPFIKVKEIKRGFHRGSDQRRWRSGGWSTERSTTNTGTTTGTSWCGKFHRLSWTVFSTVHVAFTVLLSGHHIPRAPPLFAVCPPATARLRIHGSSSPIPWLQHWCNKQTNKHALNLPFTLRM